MKTIEINKYLRMAPESLEFGEFTVKTDAFSFGVTLWELIARQVSLRKHIISLLTLF